MYRRVLALVAAGCIATVSVTAPAVAVTMTIVTDKSWEVSTDKLTWNPASPSFPFGVSPGIWDSTPAVETLYFRRTFSIPGTVNSATITDLGADDDVVSLTINGFALFSDINGVAGPAFNYLQPPGTVFHLGSNEISVEARNTQLFATFGATITIDYTPVPAPAVGAGLPGLIMAVGGLLAWSRRKRRGTADNAA